ncbi:MAG: hypothetical protein Q7T24_05565 [Deltaproteobacteria bacterium]|nr:hypothetical protein [Deltaproteobacteria bacterium]
MAIKLTPKYLGELKKGVNTPNVVVELTLDSGVVRFGFWAGGPVITRFLADGSYKADGTLFAWGSDEMPGVVPALKSVSSLQNKLDPKSGYSTRGQLTFAIAGRENFKGLIKDEHLKNRRALRKDGFISKGFTYSDYATTFAGKVLDWSRKGDELTVTVADDLKSASSKLPVENSSKTQYIDYRSSNPADIMADMLLNRLSIGADYVDSSGFASERDRWLQGWTFDRVLTEPREANEYLNELQIETNSFIVHDGEKINFKVFAPPTPSETVEEWTDENNILQDTLSIKSGYKDNFYNRIIVYYDYDESGSDKEENYEAAYIAADGESQDPSRWDEISTRVIKSKWIRTRTYTQANISGVKLYHVSKANGTGAGTLSYVKSANTLSWTAPGGTAGEAIRLSKDGKYQLFDSDKTKYTRVIAVTGELPQADQNDTVSIAPLDGDKFASSLAQKILNRYRDPVAAVSFDIDLNNAAFNSQFIRPADIKDLTTDEAAGFGAEKWVKERVMLTSVRPDFTAHKVSCEAIETRMFRLYGFIAPAGFPDYQSASAEQRRWGFVGGADNKVNNAQADGYYIW